MRFLLAALLLLAPATAHAAITFISYASADANTVNLGTFAAGDIAVLVACRIGSGTAPATPTDWTSINTQSGGSGGSATSQRMSYRVLQGGDTTTGTSTNATGVAVIVLRGQSSADPIGATLGGGSAAVQAFTFANFTLDTTTGTSWVVHGGCHFDATDIQDATLALTTNRTTNDANGVGVFTSENVASWANTTSSTFATGTSASAARRSVEIQAEVATARRGTMMGVLP